MTSSLITESSAVYIPRTAIAATATATKLPPRSELAAPVNGIYKRSASSGILTSKSQTRGNELTVEDAAGDPPETLEAIVVAVIVPTTYELVVGFSLSDVAVVVTSGTLSVLVTVTDSGKAVAVVVASTTLDVTAGSASPGVTLNPHFVPAVVNVPP